MEIIRDETEFTDIRMVQKVVGMFESHPDIQRIVRLGLLASMNCGDELDVTREEDYKYDNWVHGHNNSRGSPRLSDRKGDRGLDGNRTRSPSSDQLPLHYDTPACDLHCPPSVEVQAKESDSESRARLLQEAKKSKCKAEKKRLKKQKQKGRKQLEKLQKEKQSSVNNEEGEDDVQQSKAGERKPVNNTNSSDKHLASAQATDGCKDKSSDEDSGTRTDSDKSEELDMKSTFVSKAALIARRKLEQIPRPERREKMIPAREEPKTTPNKPTEDQEVGKKDSAVHSSSTFKDNIKISTDLANIGNRFASAGDFNMAVKYFTDAIKYNPTEFKLFGNRSFCFEKMQEYEKALTDAELSLSICPGWVKGLFRKGRALAGLKRYEEASCAFMEVLKLDSSCAEANQELKRVQITQLMRYGFTWEQSSNALVIHGTVEKALEVLSKLNHQPGRNTNDTRPPAQIASVTGVSPVLSANISPVPPQPQNAAKTPLKNKPLGLVQNIWNAPSQPQPIPNRTMKTNYVDRPPQELFPIWVGNLGHSVSESVIIDLFSKIGAVYSVKVLTNKRCAFVNFTKQEYCDEAIWRFNGYELNGIKIAVRYPDRIPQGMGISKYALKADDLQKEDLGPMEQVDVRNVVGSQRPIGTCRHVANCRGNKKI